MTFDRGWMLAIAWMPLAWAAWEWTRTRRRLALTLKCLALTAILLAERLKRSGVPRSPDDAKTLAKAEGCRLDNIRERVQPILASFATAATSGGR